MRVTTNRLTERTIGNFTINTNEDYFIRPSIEVTISWSYMGKGLFGERRKSKVVYKAKVSDRNLELARKQIEEKIREKMPVFLRMEKNGEL